jgi:hypothetical protein
MAWRRAEGAIQDSPGEALGTGIKQAISAESALQ